MLNKVILMGRLTRDPDFKTTPTGKSVCDFSLAVDRDFVRQGEERQTDFINIVTFGSKADFVSRYFHKGQLVAICGRIQTRSWDDAQTGQKRFATDIVADEVRFAESKKTSESSVPSTPSNSVKTPEGFAPAVSDENMPF